MTVYEKELANVLGSMEVHFITKDILKALDKKDPVDAVNTAETVLRLMKLRLEDRGMMRV